MTTTNAPVAVVTGASSGIGAATARALAADGYHVICAARRYDRVHDLAADIGGVAVACDITDPDDVAVLAEVAGDRVALLVNNAGGAVGQEPLAEADFDAWQRMYDTNVLGAARVTKALLPALEAAEGTVVFVTSTAAEAAYEGGAGYNAAKAGERMVVGALRLELSGHPVRVCEVAPGMVHTEEFSLTRFGGDQARADAVYAGVPDPLSADDIAEVIAWVASRPAHVNIDRLIVRPRAQAANHKVHRVG
ncbi:SDR family oxidoreductase [Propioniciclava coleopterorum]|uniref:SDR family oxidoreductase n=1 Tax=Propioniciclava coleopterorum TaxID=2714937 RepID=A0A6G7Y4H1_9ACTN|nr:SDR family oxidoreductase [Propioniciclava coleopterorum]QIK71720.1 SDR family oxidoreductase [Propioniciclava coleopterorum]